MRSLIVLLGVLVLLSGCPSGGACASSGTLFGSPVAKATMSDGGVDLEVSWQLSPSVPAAFYASPTVVSRAPLRVLDAGATGVQLRGDTQPVPLQVDLRYLEGPTRCPHPGMDDTHVLSVTFQADDAGYTAGTVTQKTELGAL